MSTITITLPDEVKSWVEQQSLQQGYQSLSEYFDDLIRTLHGMSGLTLQEIKASQSDSELDEHLKRPEVQRELEKKLLEGLHSPGTIVDEAFWENRLQALRDKYPQIDFDSESP